jgi:hypothetical protein
MKNINTYYVCMPPQATIPEHKVSNLSFKCPATPVSGKIQMTINNAKFKGDILALAVSIGDSIKIPKFDGYMYASQATTITSLRKNSVKITWMSPSPVVDTYIDSLFHSSDRVLSAIYSQWMQNAIQTNLIGSMSLKKHLSISVTVSLDSRGSQTTVVGCNAKKPGNYFGATLCPQLLLES